LKIEATLTFKLFQKGDLVSPNKVAHICPTPKFSSVSEVLNVAAFMKSQFESSSENEEGQRSDISIRSLESFLLPMWLRQQSKESGNFF
jgi:hypothetical protein